MMTKTKQAELKKQAYASALKSRALSVLIYLIDRSNKEMTCFPAIPTMAEQLHISISTVKRALHELLDSGYIKKHSRFRENNKGQTSNLYTLVLFDRSAEVSQEKKDKVYQEKCQVEHIGFDTLRGKREEIRESQKKEEVLNMEDVVIQNKYQEIQRGNEICNPCDPGWIVKQILHVDGGGGQFDAPLNYSD